ncbi:MarR family transcriptional regulator [Rhodobacteraceae bacterium RKSG542]|uniref:MarR family winged helix-turn-helix transcriptional regulator n=1 Tax=Pseudovibrio flavus TaxID=2529854 RepID=UPI0012BB6305|nr:MarR family transcriptional regulator [Pseudovibrio flavus]MTI16520.1 MarR family transcriptional regulator [Pseudovibrio flavus]
MSIKIDDEAEYFLADNVKGLMQDYVSRTNVELMEWREGSSFANLREGDVRLLGLLRGQTLSLSDLARKAGITRQAVHSAMHRLSDEGMISLVAAPDDRKQKNIQVTEKGHAFRNSVAEILQAQERRLEAKLGAEEFQKLKALLVKAIS